jgi:LysR family carnitine catabolism transcriptional activator
MFNYKRSLHFTTLGERLEFSQPVFDKTMLLDQIRAFLAVAKHLGLREACTELHLTQSAISKRLRSLQVALGAELYKPTRKGIELTDAGRLALGKMELIVKQADDLKQAFRQAIAQEKLPVVVRIAGAFSLTAQLFPAIVERFENSHADVEIQYHTGRSNQIEQMIREGRAEIGLSTHPSSAADIASEPFRVHPLVFFVSHRHPLATRSHITLADVLTCPLIIRGIMDGPKSNSTREILKQFSKRGFKYKIALECNGPLQVKESVGKNIGVGISYLENLKADVASGRLVVLKCADFQFPTFSYLVLSKKRALSPPGLEFLSLLRQAKNIPRVKNLETITAAKKKRRSSLVRKGPRLAGFIALTGSSAFDLLA